MNIISFEAKNFRNHTSSSVTFKPEINAIIGDNGEGKTNLLEGIMMFAAGKSFRGQKDREIIKFGEDTAYIKLVFSDRFSEHVLEAYLFKNKKKVLLKDGIEVKKLSEYLGLFRAVIFTPDHLRIVKSSPEHRRRLVDMAICQSFPRFVSLLSEYNRILLQKNNLLKSGITELSMPMLDVYNERLADLSAVITLNRYNYVCKLGEKAGEYVSEMTDGKETLDFVYETQYGKNFTRESLLENCISLFEKKKPDEIAKKMSLFGCHHDDFRILVNKKDARLFASQGQQRSAVLAIKLAEGELQKQYTGEDGVFLFDDVLSELDSSRRKYITDKLTGKQFIITGCENTSVTGKTITVKNGTIICNEE